jgi:N-acetylglucosaminyldiphosphoundecaprenol N-acetyl-beta-D-mannosaminyltransferase
MNINNHKTIPYVEFMSTKINAISYREVENIIFNIIANDRAEYICLTDVGNVISARDDDSLRDAINASRLSLADGAPLAYYARLAGYKNIERISGVRLMESLFAEGNGYSHYLLGDTDQTLRKAIRKARSLKGTNITGYSPPFRDFSLEDNCDIISKIHEVNPDIVWVCFGGGKQEKWMQENIGSLQRGVMVGVGSALRWFTDDLKVPPLIFQKLCLQWLYRLMSELVNEPQRGMKFFMERQLRKFPVFLMHFPSELSRARRRYQQQHENFPAA